jgi:hypothetical protein
MPSKYSWGLALSRETLRLSRVRLEVEAVIVVPFSPRFGFDDPAIPIGAFSPMHASGDGMAGLGGLNGEDGQTRLRTASTRALSPKREEGSGRCIKLISHAVASRGRKLGDDSVDDSWMRRLVGEQVVFHQFVLHSGVGIVLYNFSTSFHLEQPMRGLLRSNEIVGSG